MPHATCPAAAVSGISLPSCKAAALGEQPLALSPCRRMLRASLAVLLLAFVRVVAFVVPLWRKRDIFVFLGDSPLPAR